MDLEPDNKLIYQIQIPMINFSTVTCPLIEIQQLAARHSNSGKTIPLDGEA